MKYFHNTIVFLLAILLGVGSLADAGLPMASPKIDDPARQWNYLSKTLTLVGVPFMPNVIQITWDGAIYTGQNEMCFFYGKDLRPVCQRQKNWHQGWIPIVEYDWNDGGVHYGTEIFSVVLDGFDARNTLTFVRVTLRNCTKIPATAQFASAIRGTGSDYRYGRSRWDSNGLYRIESNALTINGAMVYSFPDGAEVESIRSKAYAAEFTARELGISARTETAIAKYSIQLKPGESKELVFKMPRKAVAKNDTKFLAVIAKADFKRYHKKTVEYWTRRFGTTTRITTPEKVIGEAHRATAVHAALGTRLYGERKTQTDGVPYQALFLIAMFDYQYMYDTFGQGEIFEVNYPHMAKAQLEDGLFCDMSLSHGRKLLSSQGQTLLSIANHVVFTQNKSFGEKWYPQIQKGIAFIAADHRAQPNGLLRPSTPYDAEMIKGHYTSHNLWAIAALRKCIVVARMLGKTEDVKNWTALHTSYEKAVLKAINVSAHKDGYVPTGLYKFITGPAARRGFSEFHTDQDWENNVLIWPTEVLAMTDRRIAGTIDRLRNTKYREGIMTYRNGQHLHQYNTTTSTKQDIVIGRAKKALVDVYHILLHGGSTYEGYENQIVPWSDRMVHGAPPPHAWGASHISGMIRNMFVMEYGGRCGFDEDQRDLYLFSTVSPAWAKPDKSISVENAITEMGTVSAKMTFHRNGADVSIQSKFHTPPREIVIRVPYFVKNASIKTDANQSCLKGGVVRLSPDVTKVSFTWTMNTNTDKTTFQDILLNYRREAGHWKGRRDQMPKKPTGFLTTDEKERPVEPLSFDLVKTAFQTEWKRRFKAHVAKGGAVLNLQAPNWSTGVRSEPLDSKSLTTGKPSTATKTVKGYSPSVANNGSLKLLSHWGCHAGGTWQVDLGKKTDVTQVIVVPYWAPDGKRIYSYKVDTSVDGKTWVTLIDKKNNKEPASRNGHKFTFQTTVMRHIRITMYGNNINPYGHLVELMAFDSANQK
ncbi:MAG: discoidin domain-containing protein [bacterium]|nr:discoidin domain-containing protein [bacterium]